MFTKNICWQLCILFWQNWKTLFSLSFLCSSEHFPATQSCSCNQTLIKWRTTLTSMPIPAQGDKWGMNNRRKSKSPIHFIIGKPMFRHPTVDWVDLRPCASSQVAVLTATGIVCAKVSLSHHVPSLKAQWYSPSLSLFTYLLSHHYPFPGPEACSVCFICLTTQRE